MEEDRTELIAQLFCLLTITFEEGAGLAADGQGKVTTAEQHRILAGQLHSRGRQVMILCDAVLALLDDQPSAAGEPRS